MCVSQVCERGLVAYYLMYVYTVGFTFIDVCIYVWLRRIVHMCIPSIYIHACLHARTYTHAQTGRASEIVLQGTPRSSITQAQHVRLRGGGGSRFDSWLKQEKLGIYSPYHSSSSLKIAASDSGGGGDGATPSDDSLNKLQKLLVACELVFDSVDGKFTTTDAELETGRMNIYM